MPIRRIQTTVLSDNPVAAPHFAVKHDLTDVLAAKYGGIQVPLEQKEPSVHPPESAFQPHKVYVSPYQDASLAELIARIDKNKIKQGKRWNKMIKKIQHRTHREKYLIPMSRSTQRRRQKKADIGVTTPMKLPPPKRQRPSKRCEILGKVPTKIDGYSYKHKKTGKTVRVGSYTRKVLKCLDK